jgi:cytochrome bd-type quinol oxidase subunit 1
VRTDLPGRSVAALTGLCVALLAALVTAPARLAAQGDSHLSDRAMLVECLRAAFVDYWRSDASDYPPDLAHVVDFWARYNELKAVIASALLVTLLALGVVLSRTFSRGLAPGSVTRLAVASAATVAWGGALGAVWKLIASIQRAIAPFGAVLPLLRGGSPDGTLAATIDQVQQNLHSGPSTTRPPPPALAEIVDSYARFHVVHAIAAALTCGIFVAAAVVLWKRSARTAHDQPGMRTTRSVAALCGLLALSFGALCAANVATAANPEPRLLGFFEGGW